MIRLEQVEKVLSSGGRPLTVLEKVSLTIPHGQFVAVMGPSGSGKSTLLGLMAGLDAPSGGRIWVDGQEVTALKEDALARFRGRSLGFVFQTFQLIPSLTALENVMVPLEIAGLPGAKSRGLALLEGVGLSGRAHHYPAQLSGGEQQRVAVARAFGNRPPVILADEPTGNLDSDNGAKVLALLARLNQEQKTTLVLVTHDAEVASMAHRIIRLKDGQVVEDSLRPAAKPAAKNAAAKKPAAKNAAAKPAAKALAKKAKTTPGEEKR